MTATKTSDRDFNVQQLEDAVQGVFAGKNAFVGSKLVSAGAVTVNDRMKADDPDYIGNEITVPYFGTLGEFADNPEDTAVVPKAIKSTNEKATVGRSSLAFETTRWSRHSGPDDMDPYEECARQVLLAANREIDRLNIDAAAGTPLVYDKFGATLGTVNQMTWDLVVEAKETWGDQQEDIVAMIVNSRTELDIRKLKDLAGRNLVLDSQTNDGVVRFAGIPLIVSNRLPLTSTTMSTVVEAGTTPPDATLSGTPTGTWDLRLKCTLLGARGVAKFQFSVNGGMTWSADILTAASVPLIDPATDSIVGINGTTGLTVAWENATFALDNTWSSKAIAKATSLIVQKGAMAFWYNRNALKLATDKDILKDNEVAAMHMYRVAHRYRRRQGGTQPGVVAIRHNVSGFLPTS